MSNIEIFQPEAITITLKEITDLISVEHNKAMKQVEKLTKEPSFGTVEKIATVYNNKGQTIDTYLLNKKQAIAVGARLNNALLMKVIDRLEELESKNPTIHLPSKKELALMVVESEEKIELLENKIEADLPKVSYAEAVVGSINPISLRDWINTPKSDEGLKVGERKVIEFLITKKFIYRGKDGKLKPYAQYAEKYFSLIPITSATPKGNREFLQLKVTGLGQLEVGNRVVEHFKEEGAA